MCVTWRSMTSLAPGERLAAPVRAQQLHGVADGGQRVAQLVGQHRQELVLAPVGLAQRLFGLLALGDIHRHAEVAQRSAGALSYSA